MGKLTNQQRAAIYAASKDGVPQKDLAKQYGVSIQAISQLINKLAKAEQGINLGTCDAAEKKPVATINKEFDDAVNAMIAEKESASAEEKSTIAAEVTPSGTPAAVMRAVADGLDVLKMDIEAREERIAELQAEIEEIRKDIAVIEAWKEEHKR
jgi:DNA-binding MarR family transcriptional regulator